jgi:hypothetical protein
MAAWRAKMDPDEKAWWEKMAAMRAELAAETEALRAESSHPSRDGSQAGKNGRQNEFPRS